MKTQFINKLTDADIDAVLKYYGIARRNKPEIIDTSRGDDDIRLNCIVDKKYVLRANSAAVMSDKRIAELNRLIMCYKEFGLVVPCFIKSENSEYIVKHNGFYFYVTEYIDCSTAEQINDINEAALYDEISVSIAKFAQRYKNTDLSETMSMYSLFELSPYDKESGIDEKQENLGNLTGGLEQIGETELARAIKEYDAEARNELLTFYKDLPRCVFQGDENLSNVLVDKNGRFVELIDFNMAGTDVIANYFANVIGFSFDETDVKTLSARQILDKAIGGFGKGLKSMSHYYDFSQEEKKAFGLYGKIVLVSSYPNERFFSFCLGSDIYRQKTVELLRLITETDLKGVL